MRPVAEHIGSWVFVGGVRALRVAPTVSRVAVAGALVARLRRIGDLEARVRHLEA
jgi:hypothetical protein